jgi:hypothetical protein
MSFGIVSVQASTLWLTCSLIYMGGKCFTRLHLLKLCNNYHSEKISTLYLSLSLSLSLRMLAFVYFPQEGRYDPKLHSKWTWSAVPPKLSEEKYNRKTQVDTSNSTKDIYNDD